MSAVLVQPDCTLYGKSGKFSNLSAQTHILKTPNLIWLNLALVK
ncbi:hypothetical protein [Campylobacter showae]|nr:hypothetical protein [Campylobacter showae]